MPTYSSNLSNGYRLNVHVTVTSQNVTNLTSTVAWRVEIVNPSRTYFSARVEARFSLNGTTLWSTTNSISSGSSGSTKTLASGTHTMKHDSYGRLNASVSAFLKTVTQGRSWSVPGLTVSGTFTPPSFTLIPPAPSNLAIWENNPQRVVYAECATTPGNILQYQLQWQHNRGGTWNGWNTISDGTNRRVSVAIGRAPVAMQWRARARTAAGWGPWTNPYQREIRWSPDKLGKPVVTTDGKTITVTAPEAYAYGTPIRGYRAQYRAVGSSEWQYVVLNNITRSGSFTPSVPGLRYEVRVNAHSDAGQYFEYSISDPVYVNGQPSGPFIFDGTEWRPSQAYVYTKGAWKPALTYFKSGRQWKEL